MRRPVGRRGKSGVSPIVSSILMTAIVVAAMAVVIAATLVITSRMRERMLERLTVEDVYFDNSTGDARVCVYVLNSGKVPLKVVAIYINGTPASTNPATLSLDVLGSGWINATYTWKGGDVVYLVVTTERGTVVGDYYKAPKQR